MAPVLKTGKAQAFVGSNPTPSASSTASSNPWREPRLESAAWRFERRSTGGARYVPGLRAKLSNWSQNAALDNPIPSAISIFDCGLRIADFPHKKVRH
jgi:hypothetical protein